MRKQTIYWDHLKQQLVVSKALNVVLLVLSTALFPILEAVLVNKWTATPPSAGAGWCLIVLGTVHLFLALYLVAQQVASPALALAEAVEMTDRLNACNREIRRRSESYRLVRSLFDILNARKCDNVCARRCGYGNPLCGRTETDHR